MRIKKGQESWMPRPLDPIMNETAGLERRLDDHIAEDRGAFASIKSDLTRGDRIGSAVSQRGM